MNHQFSLSVLGSYLPGGYPFSPYASKIAGGDEGGDKSRASPTVTKTATDSKALDILHQHASQYKSKSPTVGDKPPHDREQERGAAGDRGDRERDRERERERDMDRPRSSPSQRIMPSHHHLGYPLLSGQYDLSYATGQSVLTSAICKYIVVTDDISEYSLNTDPCQTDSKTKHHGASDKLRAVFANHTNAGGRHCASHKQSLIS